MDKNFKEMIYYIPAIEISNVLEFIYDTVFTTGREEELEPVRQKFNKVSSELADRIAAGKTKQGIEKEAKETAIKLSEILIDDKVVSQEELTTLILAQLFKSKKSINLNSVDQDSIQLAISACKEYLCGKNVFFRIFNEKRGVIELRSEDLCLETYKGENNSKIKKYRDAKNANEKDRNTKLQKLMDLKEENVLRVISTFDFEDLFNIYKEGKENYKNQYLQLAKHLIELDPELSEGDGSAERYNEVLKDARNNAFNREKSKSCALTMFIKLL